HGGKPKSHHSLVGINSRLDTIQAAILSTKLRYLDEWTEKRRKIAHRYNKMFSKAEIAISWDDLACSPECEHTNNKDCALQQNLDLVVIPSETAGSASRNGRHIYHQYVIRTARRD